MASELGPKGPGKRGHIVAHDVSWAAQTGRKHLLRTQNVSEQNQKYFLCPGRKICVRSKCCAREQTGKHFCRQQCVRNNVSSLARALSVLSNVTETNDKVAEIPKQNPPLILLVGLCLTRYQT